MDEERTDKDSLDTDEQAYEDRDLELMMRRVSMGEGFDLDEGNFDDDGNSS